MGVLPGDVPDKELAYRTAHNLERPLCQVCNNEPVRFISLKKGYGKYCGKSCAYTATGQRNTATNAKRNRVRAESARHDLTNSIETARAEYMNDGSVTLNELSERYGVSLYRLRQELDTDPHRSRNVFREGLKKRFGRIDVRLSDTDWVKDKVSLGWTTKDFAEFLGCSRDYVSVRTRGLIPNNRATSSIERFLQDRFPKAIHNSRKIIPPKELDLYFPTHKVAVEVNGTYWHSAEKVGKNYHLDKTLACERLGIRLLHFHQHEGEEKPDIVISMIEQALHYGKPLPDISNITQIPTNVAERFFDENHLHIPEMTRAFGIFSGNTLLYVVGMSYDNGLVINNYATKIGYFLPDAPLRIIEFLKRKDEYHNALIRCDRRYDDYITYKEAGFAIIAETPPSPVVLGHHVVYDSGCLIFR
jgi:very-short-patch-repair endonuclease